MGIEMRPAIQLSSLTDGDYLFIKAVNPSFEPKKPEPGRGYGMRILSELAEQYGGAFFSEYQSGVFTAVVSLLAVEQETGGILV
jgi:two-component sensor histidine kinase